MPIEIRELVIRAVVGPDALAPDAVNRVDGASPASDAGVGLSAAEQERIVQACVRQVLALLARERER